MTDEKKKHEYIEGNFKPIPAYEVLLYNGHMGDRKPHIARAVLTEVGRHTDGRAVYLLSHHEKIKDLM